MYFETLYYHLCETNFMLWVVSFNIYNCTPFHSEFAAERADSMVSILLQLTAMMVGIKLSPNLFPSHWHPRSGHLWRFKQVRGIWGRCSPYYAKIRLWKTDFTSFRSLLFKSLSPWPRMDAAVPQDEVRHDCWSAVLDAGLSYWAD
jgi:hypothetical protein